jgi:hypothetical protein
MFNLLKHCKGFFEDGSRFKIRFDSERSEFAAEAGMLESAERSLLIVQWAINCARPFGAWDQPRHSLLDIG